MSENEYIDSFINESSKYGVRLMNNESTLEQKLFLESYYRSFGYRQSLDLNWFSWYYIQNPLGQCSNYILYDIERGALIGGFGFAKISYRIKNIDFIGGLAINGFINPGYEGKGLYSQLISKGLKHENINKRMFFSFPHSSNVPSIKGHLKSGWQQLFSLIFSEIKINDSNLDSSLAIILKNPQDLKYLNFELFNKKLTFGYLRNFDFLKWRFINRPDKNYIYIQINIDENIGYMILAFYETKESVKRCQIADYRYTSESCLIHLIKKAYFVAKLNASDVLDVLINTKSEPYKRFVTEGFNPRNEGYELLMWSDTSFQTEGNIFITYGDFDTV